MRCSCCNDPLNDYESTNKALDGSYLDTCNKCLKGLGVPQLGRPDLAPDEELDDDLFDAFEEDFVDDFERDDDDQWQNS